MSLSTFDIEFTKEGRIFKEQQAQSLLDALDGISDLIVLCHGWNNDMHDAAKLYGQFLDNFSTVMDLGLVPGLEERHFAVVQVFWPSKRFTDRDLIPGGGAAAVGDAANEPVLLELLEEMKRNPSVLGGTDIDPIREHAVRQAEALVPSLDTDPTARREFVFALRTMLNPSQAHADDASEAFFTSEPEELFRSLQAPVAADIGPRADATEAGGAAGLGDLLSGMKAAARRLVNYTTYCDMKERAGTVGVTGLAPLLQRIRDRDNTIRLHLVGHSFGGRLVTAAANALPADTQKISLTLLQAAFSHNGLGQRFDGIHDGAFRDLLDERRASGPILVTHTRNDTAVGIAYPIASRLARDQAAELGDHNDPYGSMGRNGAQHTPEAVSGTLHDVGQEYRFESGKVFNLNADDFIKNHGDVTGPQVTYALLHAIRTV
ncbi:MAG TPA: hypothetical protein VM571_01430 [Noviherbaspirillum sp.]|nr:hypothetical protein [Noviherbaspirillum sp.]